MASSLGFAGRVAVVTGAGGGLGRAYALEFARRGANVVVNDLGGSIHGEGGAQNLADCVVNEIKENGGSAVANYDSVEDGDKIINTALDNFGKIDIVVNNAGILRDKSFQNLTEADMDKVMAVHFKGAFKVTKAAWPHMRAQKYGRIIMTSSPSGLYGNFGQTNYGAAKMALVGFANTLAIEGAKSNIHINTLAPMAATRMTEAQGLSGMLPEHISPFVVYMCHESCEDTGVVLEAGGGWACKTRLQRSNPVQLRRSVGDVGSVERAQELWDTLGENSLATNPSSIHEAGMAIFESVTNLPDTDLETAPTTLTTPVPTAPAPPTPDERARAYQVPDSKYMYTERDVLLYMLSIGARLPDDLPMLYEGHPNFTVFPTFTSIVALSDVFSGGIAGLDGLEDVDITRAVHGEQYIEILKPLPASGEVILKSRVIDLLNKRKFTQLIIEIDICDASGEVAATTQTVVLFLGSGVGKKGRSDKQVPTMVEPSRPCDHVVEEKTSADQAALYRLNGDFNPLHVDPEFSGIMGFPTPILHGLCTYGFSCRHVLKSFAGNDASNFKSMKAQFSKPVLPGQTLRTEMWLEGKRVHFKTSVKETGDVVIKGAYIDLHQVKTSSDVKPTGPVLKAEAIFGDMELRVNSQPDLLKKINNKFLFQITKDGKLAGEFLLDFTEKPLKVAVGPPAKKADVTIKVDDDSFEKMSTGKLNGMQAFSSGKMKISGNMMLAQKLGDLFKSNAKL